MNQMRGPVDPTAIGEMFVGAVTEAARALAERIEQEFHRDDTWSGEPRIEVLLSSLTFVLHATDRIAFGNFAPEDRELFMSTVLETLTADGGKEELRAAYNAAQRKYSAFKELVPEEGKGAGGTLFFEFAKGVCFENGDINPAVGMLLTLQAGNTFVALAETFEDCSKRLAGAE
jgi:hypothetical protein